MPALLGRERHVGEQAAYLVGVVVLDRSLEPLARRQGLRELPPQPAAKAHLSRARHTGS